MMNHKIVPYNEKVNPVMSAAMQFSKMSRLLTATVCYDYVYPLDNKVVRCQRKGLMPIASVTVDYAKLLVGSLTSKEKELEGIKNEEFKYSLHLCLDGVRSIIANVRNITLANNDVRSDLLRTYFDRMLDKPCESFDEAIQRILFYNGLFWQNKHKQNGIGRLDLILYPYYKADLEKGVITKDSAKQMLHNMYLVLGKDMAFKSAALLGDTGQVIILGGIDEQGLNVENEITHM